MLLTLIHHQSFHLVIDKSKFLSNRASKTIAMSVTSLNNNVENWNLKRKLLGTFGLAEETDSVEMGTGERQSICVCEEAVG